MGKKINKTSESVNRVHVVFAFILGIIVKCQTQFLPTHSRANLYRNSSY